MKKVKFQTDNGSIIEPKDVKPSRAEEGLRLAEVDKLRADVNDVKGMTEGLIFPLYQDRVSVEWCGSRLFERG